jgi:hypothetical protein
VKRRNILLPVAFIWPSFFPSPIIHLSASTQSNAKIISISTWALRTHEGKREKEKKKTKKKPKKELVKT